jgi:hypothetical protein
VVKEMRILNLGAGVQSTTLALMGVENWFRWSRSEPLPYPPVGLIDVAIFADTKGEPKAVYRHLEWLRFTRRQCTSEYKTEVIERHIRREILKLSPGQRAPVDNGITQLMGLSYDETARVIRVKARFQSMPWEVAFPLWQMEMTRGGCKSWLKKHYPERTIPRSACVFCPYHSNAEWRKIREDSDDWTEAIRIDEGIRNHDWTLTKSLKQQLFLHRSCVPLAQVDLREQDEKTGQRQFGFLQECEGMCGV